MSGPGPAPGGYQRPADLLRAALAEDPTRPVVTFYDHATGERVELSVATLDNWVAKTANLLQDGLGVDPGARVVLRLPAHWLAPVWLLACWSAGVLACPGGEPAGADALVTGPDGLPAAAAGAATGEVVAVSLLPMGAPFADPLPAGVLDYAREVRSYGDRFAPTTPVPADAPALELAGRTWPQAELATVDPLGLGPDDRVLCTRALDTWPSVHAALLAPLRARSGVVLVRHPDPGRLAATVSQERVTASVGPASGAAAGVRALG